MSIVISKVYTKFGDRGTTMLVGGHEVSKASLRIEAYGTVDELNAVIGIVRRANAEEPGPPADQARIDAIAARVQSELFSLGSLLATKPGELGEQQPRITQADVEALEREIDDLNAGLPTLTTFTLPGGGWTSSYLHLARTVCRRAERALVRLAEGEEVDEAAIRYLNRLSDALYVIGRWNVRQRGESEPLWRPRKG